MKESPQDLSGASVASFAQMSCAVCWWFATFLGRWTGRTSRLIVLSSSNAPTFFASLSPVSRLWCDSVTSLIWLLALCLSCQVSDSTQSGGSPDQSALASATDPEGYLRRSPAASGKGGIQRVPLILDDFEISFAAWWTFWRGVQSSTFHFCARMRAGPD